MVADIVDFGTKWKNMPGTRDQMIKFGWDQGPNGKNWLGPGTIGPPHSESHWWGVQQKSISSVTVVD